MNTAFFKYAIEVDRTRSITQAAENLFMAQPNLSKAIKDAEEALGYDIFERTSKGVIPTAKGSLFLEYARNIVQQLEKMEGIAGGEGAGGQKLSVSMPRGSYISKALIHFTASLDRSKGMELNIIETGSMQTVNNIADGKFRLGIVRYQTVHEQYFQDYFNEKNLGSELIWNFNYLALMSEKHVHAHKATLLPEDLRQSIEIVHGDTSVPYLAPEKNARQSGASVNKRIYLYERANQFELLSHIPESFMWVSPIPQDILERYSLAQRKCDFPYNDYKDVLICKKDNALSLYEKRFIDMVYEAKNEVSFKKYS